MSCESCLQPFNLANRYPVELPCCNETICKDCQLKLTEVPQQDTFQCPITDCGEQNSCKAIFKINKYAEKQLRESLSILCDNHPNDLAEYYCKDHELLVCIECTFKQHNNHNLTKINKKILIEYHKILLGKLEVQYRRIAKLMGTIEAYQKNQKTFTATKYFKMINKTIAILTPQMKTQEERDMIKFLQHEIQAIQQNQFEQIPQQVQPIITISDSLIIKNDDHSFIKECFGQSNIRFELLYRGSRDTFAAKKFHSLCDNKGPTLTVIQSEHNRVFGGYASASWTCQDLVYVADANAFIISLSNKTKHTQYRNKENALVHHSNFGPIFGDPSRDIVIFDNCNNKSDNYCNLGNTYSLPNGIQFNTEQAKQYLAGSYNFKVLEIEVFKVIIN